MALQLTERPAPAPALQGWSETMDIPATDLTLAAALVELRAQVDRLMTAAELFVHEAAGSSLQHRRDSAEVLRSVAHCLSFPLCCLNGSLRWGIHGEGEQ